MNATIKSIPSKFTVVNFTANYKAHFNASLNVAIWTVIVAASALLTLSAIFTSLTGPDSLYIRGDMSLTQFWQLYPGPIATIGFLLTYGCTQLVSINKSYWEVYFINHVEVIYKGEKLDFNGYELRMYDKDKFIIAKNNQQINDFIFQLNNAS
ncbi:hypothetical protein CWB85_06700 [Pseudoalteromonas sp. S1727]|uniref:hypothetical protein n=1 Tax=Pseudoalteromonas sp. S1727 TaxID=2066514 RepID=UPI00110854B8|nr:hypothetical protein [Pseudoalteromonas sp. S1727]TMN72491.1 hypothetical protein CWB85_06700 [Pseudoalteromonas sp. S1727]